MTFDELWRLDLAQKGSPMSPLDTPENVEPIARSPEGAAVDDVEEEINRFLYWLEKRLLSASASDGAF